MHTNKYKVWQTIAIILYNNEDWDFNNDLNMCYTNAFKMYYSLNSKILYLKLTNFIFFVVKNNFLYKLYGLLTIT